MGVKKRSPLVLALGLVFIVGCNTGPPQAPTAVLPTLIPTLPPTSVPPTPTVASPVISSTPAAVVPLDRQLIATVGIQHPDEIVVLNDSVWVKSDDGRLWQVDPSTNQIVGELQLDASPDPYRRCQGLGADDTSIWACSASDESFDVVRVDPATRSIVATVKVAKIFDQFRMPYLANRIWVLSGNADKLIGIDVATNQPGLPIDLGVRCFQVAATRDALVVSCEAADLVLKVDPIAGKVAARMTLDDPNSITATADAVWVGTATGIARLNAGDLTLAATFAGISPGSRGDVYATDDTVWVRHAGRFLFEIDPRSNSVVRQITADPALSGGSVAITADSIWTTAYDDHVLYRLKR